MTPSAAVMGLLALAVLVVALVGVKLPPVTNPRVSLALFLVLGMGVCAAGIGRVAATGAWTHPLAILGYLLGALILVVGIAGVAGLKLPWIDGARQALIAVAVLSGAKIVNTLVHSLLGPRG